MYHEIPDQEWNTLCSSIGLAQAISYSVHDRHLKGKVNADFVNMDRAVIRAMATSFVTCSYKPQLGSFKIPENPNKRTNEDMMKIRLQYNEVKVDIMDLMRKQIWSLSKFLLEEVCIILFHVSPYLV